jgi:hypothetical protein
LVIEAWTTVTYSSQCVRFFCRGLKCTVCVSVFVLSLNLNMTRVLLAAALEIHACYSISMCLTFPCCINLRVAWSMEHGQLILKSPLVQEEGRVSELPISFHSWIVCLSTKMSRVDALPGRILVTTGINIGKALTIAPPQSVSPETMQAFCRVDRMRLKKLKLAGVRLPKYLAIAMTQALQN